MLALAPVRPGPPASEPVEARRPRAPRLILAGVLVGLWTVTIAMVVGGSRSGQGASEAAGSVGGLAAFCQLHLRDHSTIAVSWLDPWRWVSASVMVLAMMLPATRPALDYVRRQSLRSRRPRAVVEFLVAYTAVWTIFLVAATALMAAARARMPSGLTGDPTLALTGALAAAWLLSRRRRRLLGACRRARPLAIRGWPATRGTVGFGAAYGARCLATCGALMLVTIVDGPVGLAVMAVVAVYVWFERTHPRQPAVTNATAALLGIGALVALLV
jgi:predicted metal-binding membrane protein